jgi:RNA polymerase sigma-70 factor (ECF subfamily)
MRTASLTLTDQSSNENTIVAQGLKRHDPELLDQLIVQYQHRLLRYLLYLTGNRETAEDIFQVSPVSIHGCLPSPATWSSTSAASEP